MGNATWVCFCCREVVRRPAHYSEAVRCPRCSQASQCLGTKLRIPTKADDRGWQALRTLIRDQRLLAVARMELIRVRRRHCMERQIAAIEARPANAGRERAIRRLRQKLASSQRFG